MANNKKRRRCNFCKAKSEEIDYKDVSLISKYLNRWNKIEPASRSGLCSRHQRELSRAIKRARFLALLPYTAR